MEDLYLAIDIGGTNLKSGLITKNGAIRDTRRITTPHNLADFMQTIHQMIDSVSEKNINGVAFCSPGKIDHNTIYFGGSLPFLDEINFAKRLSEYHLPMAVVNDGKANVLAESWLGNLKDISNGAAITLGTAIGGGIILNHQLVMGEHGQAGEFSVMELDYHKSGFNGYAAVTASAVEMIKKINKQNQVSDLTNGRLALAAVEGNDLESKKIFASFCQKIAYLIINIQSVIDLKRYVIGGGISANPLVIKEINRQFDKICDSTPIIKHCLTRPEILNAKFASDANLYGALYNLLSYEEKSNE